MKNSGSFTCFLLLIGLFINTNLSGQIIIKPFQTNSSDLYDFTYRLESKMTEILSGRFFIPERSSNDAYSEIQRTQIREHFRKALGADFAAGEYVVSGTVIGMSGHKDIVDIKFEILEVTKNKKIQLSQDYLDIRDVDKIALLAANYIINKVPTWYPVTLVYDEETISVDYGASRGAKRGDDLLLIYWEKNLTVGEIDVVDVYTDNSKCEFSINEKGFELDANSFRDFLAQTKIDVDEAETFREKLKSLRVKIKENNDWIVITGQNYQFYQESLKGFYNKKSFSPLLLGIKINLAKADTRVFLRAKYNPPTSVIDTLISGPALPVTSKREISFWEAGMGIQQNIPVFNFIKSGFFVYPGFSVSANYVRKYYSVEANGNTTKSVLNGVNLEAAANVSVNLGDFGIYGELAYNLFPYFKSEDGKLDFKGSALSFGVGLIFFFK